jgi:serine protease
VSSASTAGEEVTQEGGGLGGADAGDHRRAVVEGRLGEDVEDAAGGAGLGVGGAEDDGRDAGEDDRPGAHRAGLEGDVEGRVREAPAAELGGGGADRQELGVGGRVAAQLALVASRRQELAAAVDRGADRDVAVGLGRAGMLEGNAHRLGMEWIFRRRRHLLNGRHRFGSMSADNFGGPEVFEMRPMERRQGTFRALFAALFALGLALALGLSPTADATTGLSPAAPARGFAPRQLVVKFDGQRSGRTIGLPAGTSVLGSARALRANPRVEYAEPNYAATASAAPTPTPTPVVTPELILPNDSGSLEATASSAAVTAGAWDLKQWDFLPFEAGTTTVEVPTSPGGIDAVGAWANLEADGAPGARGITVAVLDSGIAYRALGATYRRSPDFAASQFVPGYDFVDNDSLPLDENGHGTHVAGTIAEQTNNGIGLTGLAYNAKLMPVRVLNKNDVGYANRIAKGIRFAIAHKAQVINMSFNFGCGEKVPTVDEALREAYAHGVVTVASGGNVQTSGPSCVSEPAMGPRVIGVGGTTEGGCLGEYSLSGTGIDVLAPGGGLPVAGCLSPAARPIYQVTLKPGPTNEFTIPTNYFGTSMAAAHASGVVAMILASGVIGKKGSPQAKVDAVTRRLRSTARSIGLPATQQGAGLIDAARATASEATASKAGAGVAALAAGVPVP